MASTTTTSTTTTTTSTTEALRRAALVIVSGGAPAARRRALGALWRAQAPQGAILACRAGAHRHATAAERRRQVEAALGCAPRAVLALVDAAHAAWDRRGCARGRQRDDALAQRRAGDAPRRAILRELRRIVGLAGFRAARHSHDTDYHVGAPAAESESGRCRPSEVGLCHAYARQAYWVATSHHSFAASASLFELPCSERWGRGWVQLAPDVRVRQGRGTALVVEHRPARGAGGAQ